MMTFGYLFIDATKITVIKTDVGSSDKTAVFILLRYIYNFSGLKT